MYMFLFLLYWVWSLLSFWASLRDAIDMHHLYTSRLKISPVDLHTIEWSEVSVPSASVSVGWKPGKEAGRRSPASGAGCREMMSC